MSRGCVVTIENSGRTFTCDGQSSVLDAAIDQGIQLPYNCRGGACGTCKAQILEGAVQHGWVMGFAITDQEIAAGRCLTCSSRPISERLVLRMLSEVTTVATSIATVPAESACEVVAADDVTPTVRRIVLLLPPAAHFTYEAGMYADVLWDEIETPRPYSIANAPDINGEPPAGMLAFLIARHRHGAASTRLHAEVRVGHTLRIRGPYGTFRLPTSLCGPVLMLAGGTGIAPLLAMAQQLLRKHFHPVQLLFSVRTVEEVFCLNELHELSARHGNFRFRLFVTRAQTAPGCWERHTIVKYLAEHPPEMPTRVFVAGGPDFVSACVAQLVRGGMALETIGTEAYTARP